MLSTRNWFHIGGNEVGQTASRTIPTIVLLRNGISNFFFNDDMSRFLSIASRVASSSVRRGIVRVSEEMPISQEQQAAPQARPSIDPKQVRQALMNAYAQLVGGVGSGKNENTVGVVGAPFDHLSKEFEYSVFMNLDRAKGLVDVFSTVHHDTDHILQIPLKDLARGSGLTKLQNEVMGDIQAAMEQFDEMFPDDGSGG